MLQVNQLCGFGVGGSAYAAGSIAVTGGDTSNSVTSGTTLARAFTGTEGRLLVAVVAADNNGTNGVHSFAGLTLASGGSGGATVIQDAYDPGAAAAGAGLAVYTILQTVSGANTATITFSPSTTAKAIYVFEVYHSGGAPVTAVAESHNGATGTTPSVTVSALAGDLLLGVMAVEARTGSTADAAPWGTLSYGNGLILNAIADTTVAGTSMVVSVQDRAISADGSYTWAPTLSASRDYMAGIVTFRASP